MVFDVARVRGLYTSLGDGWTYLSAHAQPQIPERVSSAVARGFRQAPVVEYVEPLVIILLPPKWGGWGPSRK